MATMAVAIIIDLMIAGLTITEVTPADTMIIVTMAEVTITDSMIVGLTITEVIPAGTMIIATVAEVTITDPMIVGLMMTEVITAYPMTTATMAEATTTGSAIYGLMRTEVDLMIIGQEMEADITMIATATLTTLLATKNHVVSRLGLQINEALMHLRLYRRLCPNLNRNMIVALR